MPGKQVSRPAGCGHAEAERTYHVGLQDKSAQVTHVLACYSCPGVSTGVK